MINLPYYGQFLERYGFRKAKDYHAYELEVQTPIDPHLERLAEGARARRNIETRMANMKAFHEEVRLLVRICNEAWAQNWCETSMLLEDNDLILKVPEHMGPRHYKTWRTYDMEL